jgi:cytochrome c biogenesis protein CcmG/thiol:disulfide interchange protein DsbE
MKTTATVFTAACLFAAVNQPVFAADTDAPALEENRNRAAIEEMQGKPAPALSVTNWINSKPLTLADLKGKIVVIDFWATWCGPCLASVPHSNELQKKYADKGVVFIGVCCPQGGEKMAETVKTHGIEYAVVLDTGEKGDTFAAYKADSYPDYFIIDRQGNLHWGDVVNDNTEKAIELLLAEKN